MADVALKSIDLAEPELNWNPKAQALTAYAQGVSDSSACTLTFQRSSGSYDAGFPVRATVGWTASWTGTGPGVPAGEQALDGIVLSSTTEVPVRESQATVTATD